MTDIGRFLILCGLGLAAVGLALWALGRAGFQGLPGDVRVETKTVRIYFPIVTCIVLSILLTALIWVWRWLSGK